MGRVIFEFIYLMRVEVIDVVDHKAKRERFSSSIAVFFATLSSTVGLGNIWKFPYLTGNSGGGAFLFVYLLCIVFVGIPVMISEFYIGRTTRKNAIGAFEQLKPRTSWKYIGVMGVVAAYLIIFFYSCVAGWVYYYVFKALRGDFVNATAKSVESQFNNVVLGPFSPIIWQIVVIVVVSTILILGVRKGIEQITKRLMPLLFILIIICDIRALTLSGASEGLAFLFKVDFTKFKPAIILTALGLAFFKFSIGMGTMITYGSYFTEDNNMLNTSAKVALSDTIISLLAGIAIFPAVFSFGMEPGAGPGLLFMTLPLVFSNIPFGNYLLIIFFLLTSFAATMAMLSMVEVPVAYLSEEQGISRKNAVIITAIIVIGMGMLASLSAGEASLLSKNTIFGMRFFDLFDYFSSNILLPAGGFLIALFVGFAVRKEDFKYEISNHGTLKIGFFIEMFYFLIKYVTPALIFIIFLNSIGII